MPSSLGRSAISLFIGGLLVSTVLLGVVPAQSSVGKVTVGIAEVDGASVWRNATVLEQLGASYPAYRCAGSAGANASADWILSRFQEQGLETWTEEFQFYGWDLTSKPSMVVTFQNGSSASNLSLGSFQAEHFSFATPNEGALGEVVLLPLPSTRSIGSFSGMSYNQNYWQGIDIHNRIVLVGREVRWNPEWEAGLADKLQEGPAALVFYYSQAWTSSWEVMYSASSGGRPLSNEGSYLHYLKVPAGHLDIDDSEWLLDEIKVGNVTGQVRIESREGVWAQRNVVALLPGEAAGSEQVLLTAHYDSIMDEGFCDNALGVATILEMASRLADMRDNEGLKLERSILFVAFTGEELGLVGSNYYYAMHASEIEEVMAVINIDCPGAGALTRTPTYSSNGIDLDELVDQVASSAGISSSVEDGGSDQQSFLYPSQVAEQIQSRWGLSPDIPLDATQLISSISVFSAPLTPLEPQPWGWIHTSRDSSAFCSASGWVSEDHLSEQGDVILAVCLDLIGASEAPADDGSGQLPTSVIIIAILATVSVAVILGLVLRRRRSL